MQEIGNFGFSFVSVMLVSEVEGTDELKSDTEPCYGAFRSTRLHEKWRRVSSKLFV